MSACAELAQALATAHGYDLAPVAALVATARSQLTEAASLLKGETYYRFRDSRGRMFAQDIKLRQWPTLTAAQEAFWDAHPQWVHDSMVEAFWSWLRQEAAALGLDPGDLDVGGRQGGYVLLTTPDYNDVENAHDALAETLPRLLALYALEGHAPDLAACLEDELEHQQATVLADCQGESQELEELLAVLRRWQQLRELVEGYLEGVPNAIAEEIDALMACHAA